MVKRVKRGEGIFEHEVNVPERSDFATDQERAEAVFAAIEQYCIPKNVRNTNFERCLNTLRGEGFPDDFTKWDREEFNAAPENSAVKFAHKWICHYKSIERISSEGQKRQLEPQEIEDLIIYAERLGALTKEMEWRGYVEPKTGKGIEELALKGRQTLAVEKERGKRSGSKERKEKRLEQLLRGLEEIIAKNPAMRRIDPDQVAKIVAEDLAEADPTLWSQGLGQAESYRTILASEQPYIGRYQKIFFDD
jgi:hypothetical protein